MKLRINDKVTWSSSMGDLSGTIVDIVLDLNAANQTVPWIVVKLKSTTVRLCATDLNLKMLKVCLA